MNLKQEKSLALFDFDGTITTKDTFIEFLKYKAGILRFFIGFTLMSPILVGFKIKIIPNWKAKETVLKYFFGGMTLDELTECAKSFTGEKLQKLIRPKAIEKIKEHLNKNHRIIVVSASVDVWLKHWCDSHNLELISTNIETKNDIVTGKISGKNCYGPEKVARIKKYLNLNEFKTIYAYGDSKGDKEMLQLAKYPHYKPFRIK